MIIIYVVVLALCIFFLGFRSKEIQDLDLFGLLFAAIVWPLSLLMYIVWVLVYGIYLLGEHCSTIWQHHRAGGRKDGN